jgi:predicted ribosomally synthesized peptide with nif11-like leader
MSANTVRAFWQKANQDAALQAQLKTLAGRNQQAITAAVVQIAAAAGFAFSAADYEVALKEELARRHAAGELSEQQIEQVAGGNTLGGVPINSSISR